MMKIRIMKKFYLALLFLGIFVGFLSSCSDDDDNWTPVPPTVTIESESGSFSTLPMESIVLKAKIDNPTETNLAWFVNGEKVATDSIYTFTAESIGNYNVSVIAYTTNSRNHASTSIEVHGKY